MIFWISRWVGMSIEFELWRFFLLMIKLLICLWRSLMSCCLNISWVKFSWVLFEIFGVGVRIRWWCRIVVSVSWILFWIWSVMWRICSVIKFSCCGRKWSFCVFCDRWSRRFRVCIRRCLGGCGMRMGDFICLVSMCFSMLGMVVFFLFFVWWLISRFGGRRGS